LPITAEEHVSSGSLVRIERKSTADCYQTSRAVLTMDVTRPQRI